MLWVKLKLGWPLTSKQQQWVRVRTLISLGFAFEGKIPYLISSELIDANLLCFVNFNNFLLFVHYSRSLSASRTSQNRKPMFWSVDSPSCLVWKVNHKCHHGKVELVWLWRGVNRSLWRTCSRQWPPNVSPTSPSLRVSTVSQWPFVPWLWVS